MESEYTYTIRRGEYSIPITPSNIADLKTEVKRPVDTCMGFRKVLKGNPVIKDSYQYEWLLAVENSVERKEKMIFTQLRLVNGLYIHNYTGYFTAASCKYDKNRRTIEVVHEPDDEYTNILENYNTAVNFLGAPVNGSAPVINATIWKYGAQDFNDHDSRLFFSTSVSTNATNDYIQNGKEIGILDSEEADYTDVTIYATETISSTFGGSTFNKNSSLDVSGWTVIPGSRVRPPNFDFAISDFKIVRNSNLATYPTYDQVFTWYDGSVGGGLDFTLLWNVTQHQTTGTIPNTRKFVDALKYIVGQIDSSIEPAVASDISLYFSQANGQFPSVFKDVRIAQITDVKYLTGTAASIGEIKLKDLLEDLNKLGLYWFINSSGKFQLEHWYYQQSLTGTNDLLADFPQYLKWSDRFEYTKNEVPKRETWSNNNGSSMPYSGNFSNSSILYDDLDRINEDEDEGVTRDIKAICFDLRDIWRNAGSYNNKLAVLIAVDDSGNIYNHETSSELRLNYPFDFEILLGYSSIVSGLPALSYERYGSSFTLTNMSRGSLLSLTSESLLYRKKQVSITTPFLRNEAFDYMGQWVTGLGSTGRLDNAIINHRDSGSTITFNILHPEETHTNDPLFPVPFGDITDPSTDNTCNEEGVDNNRYLTTPEGHYLLIPDGSGNLRRIII